MLLVFVEYPFSESDSWEQLVQQIFIFNHSMYKCRDPMTMEKESLF